MTKDFSLLLGCILADRNTHIYTHIHTDYACSIHIMGQWLLEIQFIIRCSTTEYK